MSLLPHVPKSPRDLNHLRALLADTFSKSVVNVEHIQRLLESYKSNPKDWLNYAKYDPHKYTRNLIDAGNGKYNLMLLCWAESQGSSIHDHSNSHCFMKCLDGEFVETKYEWPTEQDGEMKVKSRSCLKKDQVCYMDDSMGLHRLANASRTKPSVSLHCYIPPFSHCYSFDPRTGQTVAKCKITFGVELSE